MKKKHIKISFLMIVVVFLIFGYSNLIYAQENSKENSKKESESPKTEKKIIPIMNLDALYTYSKIQGYDAINGGLINGTFSPVIKINDKHYIIPLYNLNFNRSRQIISEEEGGWLVKQNLNHNVYLTNKLQLTKKLITKVSGFATWAYYMETKDERWSEGLYDYTDVGGIIDLEYGLSHPKDKIYQELGFEAEYYRRQYPNFKSLISLATSTAIEKDEKDYDGIKFALAYLRDNPSGLSMEAEYQPLLKYFTDKLVVDSNGVLISGKERKDNQHTINLNFVYPLRKRLKVALNNQIIIARGNQNFYDSRDTIILSDDVFTADYYSYNSFKIKPKITYDIPIKDEKKLTLDISYSYLEKKYTDRKAQTSTGSYTDSKEKDKYHIVSLGLSYPLTKNIKALCLFDHTRVSSNMKYEELYRYNYNLISIAGGLSCRF